MKIPIVLIIAGAFVLLYYGLVQRFLNPDMTETKLLFTFWVEYLIGVILLMVGYNLLKNRR